jgi:hypothetical protein
MKGYISHLLLLREEAFLIFLNCSNYNEAVVAFMEEIYDHNFTICLLKFKEGYMIRS